MNVSLRASALFLLLSAFPATRAHAQVASPARSMPSPMPIMVDVDGDGRADLALLDEAGKLRLLHNESETFRETTEETGLAELGALRLVRWSDFDRDGRQDLLAVSASGAPRLLRSSGAGFEPVDGLPASIADVAGAEWLEVSGDGWPDLWLAHAGGALLLANEGGRSFRSLALELPPPVTGVTAAAAAAGAATGAAVLGEPEEAREISGPARSLGTSPADLPGGVSSPAPDAARSRPLGSPADALPVGPGGSTPIQLGPSCAKTIDDRASGDCLSASSAPLLGTLYPLGPEFNIAVNGNVGIGTTLTAANRLTVDSVSGSTLQLRGPGSNDSQARLSFGSGGAAGGVYLEETLDEALTIRAGFGTALLGGKVTVGSSSVPTHRLTVTDPSSDDVLRLIGPGGFGSGARLNFGDDDLAYLREDIDDSLEIYAFGRTALLGGDVGIGTSSPTSQLTVSSPTEDALRLLGPGVADSQARFNFGDAEFVYLYEDVDDSLEIHSAGRTAFTGGAVGIGTKTPLWPLHVLGTQAVGRFDSTANTFGSVIELRNLTPAPSMLGGINFVNSAGQFRGQLGYRATDDMTFNTSGVERMRISAAGDVGIGTTTPSVRLSVSGTSGGAVSIVVNDGTGNGLTGLTLGANAFGLDGTHFSAPGSGGGVRGATGSAAGYGVFSNGSFGGTGAKYFVQPHPSDPAKEVRFVCLEGNESGTYFRGSAELRAGVAVIDVPEDFRLVSEPAGLTVQVTPRGPARAWVERVDLDQIVVRGDLDVSFDYFVNGVRRGFADLECVRENRAYVPETRGVPYGTQYPPALRRVLVENGTLNPDFTPNEATAARLGWTLADPPAPRPQPGEPR